MEQFREALSTLLKEKIILLQAWAFLLSFSDVSNILKIILIVVSIGGGVWLIRKNKSEKLKADAEVKKLTLEIELLERDKKEHEIDLNEKRKSL